MAQAKIMQVAIEIAGSISPTLGKMTQDAVKSLEGVNVKARAVAAAAGAAAVGIAKGVWEGGKYLNELGKQFDAATDAIRIGTGATGEALDDLLADFDAVYASVPGSMDNAAQAVADFNTRLGVSGPTLQELSRQAVQVSDMLGDDLGGVIEHSSQAFQAWQMDAENMAGAMDYVFKASQSTGMGFTDLMSKVQQFGPQLRDMGYSFEESVALIGQMEKAGVNTEEALAAMRKGVATLAKEGISASAGLEHYSKLIKEAGSQAEATAIASELFGTRAGPTMAAAIRAGTLSVDELTASLMESSETIAGAAEDTYDYAERMQLFKQKAEVALKPLANTMFDSLNSLMPVLSDAMDAVIPVIQDVVEVLSPLVEEIFTDLVSQLGPILQVVVQVGGMLAKTLLPPLIQIVKSVMPLIMLNVKSLIPIIKLAAAVLSPLIKLVANLITPILDLIDDALGPVIDAISDFVDVAVDVLGPAIDFVAGLFSGVLSRAIDGIRPVIDAAIGIFTGLIDFVKNVFTGNWSGAWEAVKGIFASIWDGIQAALKFPVNLIIDGLNLLIGGLNKIKLPEWKILGSLAGKGIDIPLIPHLARGGFTDGLSIAGEDGREAVISFDRAYREENIRYWQEAGELLGVMDGVGLKTGIADQISQSYTYDNSVSTQDVSKVGDTYADMAGDALIVLRDVPMLARGGFTDGISIAGEAGSEAVISFDPAYREQNLGYWARAGRILTGNSLISGGDAVPGSTNITLQFGDFVFSPQISSVEGMGKEELLEALKESMYEFYDLLEEWLKDRVEGVF